MKQTIEMTGQINANDMFLYILLLGIEFDTKTRSTQKPANFENTVHK